MRVFKKVDELKRNKNAIVTPLVNEIMNGKDISYLEAVKWGTLHESDAIQSFEMHESPNHIDKVVHKCGLFLKNNMPYIGATPDAIAICKCHGQAVLEVKCPLSIRNDNILNKWAETHFLKKDKKNG